MTSLATASTDDAQQRDHLFTQVAGDGNGGSRGRTFDPKRDNHLLLSSAARKLSAVYKVGSTFMSQLSGIFPSHTPALQQV